MNNIPSDLISHFTSIMGFIVIFLQERRYFKGKKNAEDLNKITKDFLRWMDGKGKPGLDKLLRQLSELQEMSMLYFKSQEKDLGYLKDKMKKLNYNEELTVNFLQDLSRQSNINSKLLQSIAESIVEIGTDNHDRLLVYSNRYDESQQNEFRPLLAATVTYPKNNRFIMLTGLIDTGADICVISNEIAEVLQLDPYYRDFEEIMFNTGIGISQKAAVATFDYNINKITIKNVRTLISGWAPVAIFGRSLLNHFKFILDGPNKEFHLYYSKK